MIQPNSFAMSINAARYIGPLRRRFMACAGPATRPSAALDKVPEDRLAFHAEPEAALARADFDAIAGGGCGGCRGFRSTRWRRSAIACCWSQRSAVEILLEALASKLASVQARSLVAH